MQGQESTATITPKREFIYERCQTAGQVGAIMMIVAIIGGIGALLALINYGWWPALALFILSALAFGLSRLSDLIGDLFGLIEREPKGD